MNKQDTEKETPRSSVRNEEFIGDEWGVCR